MYEPKRTTGPLFPMLRQPLSTAVRRACSPRLARHPVLAATTLCVALGASPMALSTTFTVTNLNDTGPGSLRQAVQDSNANPGADLIAFRHGLTGWIPLGADLVISDSVEIDGPGLGALTISGSDGIALIVIDTESNHDVDFTCSGVTMRGGSHALLAEDMQSNTYDLALIDSEISDTSEAALYIASVHPDYHPDPATVSLELVGSTISGNDGVGVEARYARLAIVDSVVSGNEQGVVSRRGTATIHNSEISANVDRAVVGWRNQMAISDSAVTDNGMGIDVGGYDQHGTVLRIVDSRISGNHGAGVTADYAYVDISNSTISGNAGAGLSMFDAGGWHFLRISDSTISHNQDGGVALALGLPGDHRILNSTVSGNSARPAILVGYSTHLNVANSTIAQNPAGGIYTDLDGDVSILNSIVSTNGSADRHDIEGKLSFSDFSLIGDPGDTVITETVPGSNLFGVDPLLGPLQDNGGPTLTHALLPGSPAIDAGDPGFVPPPDYDQRGAPYLRVGNGRIDMGSYEVQVDMPPMNCAWVTSLGDVNDDGVPDIAVTSSANATEVKDADGKPLSRFGGVGAHVLAVERVPDLAGSPAAELATLTLDLASGANAVQLYDTLTGAALPPIDFDPTFTPRALAVLDDVDGNGLADIAVLGTGRDNGKLRATVKDAFTGRFIKYVWFDQTFTPVKLLPVPDLNANGSQELALLAYDPVGLRTKVELHDGRFGTWLGNVWFDGGDFAPLDMALVDDLNGDGIDDIAILGRNVNNGNVRVAIKDLKTGRWLNQVAFDATPPAQQLVVVPDFSGNDASEIGVLQVDDAREQARVAFKDSRTREWIGLVWANGAYAPADVAVLADVNGNGSKELAVLGDIDGQLRTLIKDSATDGWLGVIEFDP